MTCFRAEVQFTFRLLSTTNSKSKVSELIKRAVTIMVRSKKKENDNKKITTNVSLLDGSNSVHAFSEPEVTSLRQSLLSWYDTNKRDLPWRQISTKDINQKAYAVWVSEIMLQQTQVATVINYYNKWMQKWPTLQDLAVSNIEEVNVLWSGLGYYSRGRRLFEGAQKVVNELSGEMPKKAADLQKILPGVGPYTAGAIASIALGEVTGLVDGNVIRVLSRLRSIGASVNIQEVLDTIWSLANQIVDPQRPGDFNQSLMEIGATVCTPKAPSCGQCPVKGICRAYAMVEKDRSESAKKLCVPSQDQEKKVNLVDIECLIPDCKLCLPSDQPWDRELGVQNFPRKPKKASAKQEEINVLVAALTKKDNHHFMVCQRPQKGLLAGMWEFPSCSGQNSISEISEAFSKKYNLKDTILQELKPVGEVMHMFSHVHHLYKIWAVDVDESVEATLSTCELFPTKWLTEHQIKEAALSTGMRKVFKIFQSFSQEPKTKQKRKRNPSDEVVLKDPKKKQSSISHFFQKKQV
ncbi:adenine DNA glycosylase-like [Physella acuta]|uniref:adenine DNA glycosylase-like n=1 Tax=Physella acuta TaxID=109671 RepID=UPI0027DDE6E2|nr:adenine DNA glycosylase-like [Physella acuta]